MKELHFDRMAAQKQSLGKVCFIAHSNRNIGAGHVMRSLSLALTFQNRGYQVSFFSKYEAGIHMIQKAGIDVISMPGKIVTKPNNFFYGNMDELEDDILYISNQLLERIEVMVVDTYNISENFLLGLRELAKCLIYIDDLNKFCYPVDIIVNGTASAFDLGYEKKQTACLLLGLEYNLLRSEFYEVKSRRIENSIEDILITTGNSDPYHVTEQLLHRIQKDNYLARFRYHVIIGSGFEKNILSDSEIINNKKIHLYNQPDNMSEIMMKCDLAITAGGTTVYELAACGIPSMVFAYADNQLSHIRVLKKKKIIEYIGYYHSLEIGKITEYIKYFETCSDKRKDLINKLQSLIDGKGCERVVNETEEYLK